MRSLGRRWAAPAVALGLMVLPGCSGGEGPGAPPPAQTQPGAATTPGPSTQAARPQDVRVIRAWADTLRKGRVRAAARHFTVPALVENGTPLVELPTRAAVRGFNSSLPCGAKLIAARQVGGYTVGTFRLTDRPGGGCGTGTGTKAATAFRLRGGKIQEWRRVPVPEGAVPPREPQPPPEV